jgi:pteridine reductase
MLAVMSRQRVALVTGGAKRVGRAIVQRLAGAGFQVAFTWHQSDHAAHDLHAELERAGAQILPIQCDLSRPEDAVEIIARQFEQRFERIDLLVNNASIYEPSPLHQASVIQLRRMMAIHLEAPLLLVRHFERPLRQARGHVINMVDLLAERPWPQYLGYCASKAALANLTLGLARELAPEVTVNGIAPGVVEWPQDFPQQDREKYMKRVPLARAGTPSDAAELVHFLATGGTYITGQIIRLDGGRSVT